MDDGRDGVEEEEMLLAAEFGDGLREAFGGERSAGDDDGRLRNFCRFLADDFDVRVVLDFRGDAAGEVFAVHCQRRARGKRGGFGAVQEHGVQVPEFVLQDAGGAVGQVRAKRVGADQFGKVAGEMRAGGDCGAHLVEPHFQPALGGLPGGFTARQPAADDGEGGHEGILPFDPLRPLRLRGPTAVKAGSGVPR